MAFRHLAVASTTCSALHPPPVSTPSGLAAAGQTGVVAQDTTKQGGLTGPGPGLAHGAKWYRGLTPSGWELIVGHNIV